MKFGVGHVVAINIFEKPVASIFRVDHEDGDDLENRQYVPLGWLNFFQRTLHRISEISTFLSAQCENPKS
jgi:hypothetical protein